MLLVIFVAFVWLQQLYTATGALKQCTSSEALVNGHFSCLDDCDENHIVDNWMPYCLSYFANDGKCYLKPYAREDILTCNGNVGPTDPPIWFVLVGGSNNYFMLKVILDKLLDLPPDAVYDPKQYWNAQDYADTGDILYSEIALMDFIWDAEHQVIRRTAWWWDGACYYCLPSNTEEIYLDVPSATTGSFRISYVNLHYADDFAARFDLAVSPGSDWLSLNPTVHVYMEWTGFWGDWGEDSTGHAANVQHLQDRRTNEGINIASFTMTDSAEDCNSGAYWNIDQILIAFADTPAHFPKRYFSKRDMQFDEAGITGFCMANGHTYEPLNWVFAMRYFNIICNGEEVDINFQSTIPACVDLGVYGSQCFQNPGGLLGNLEHVCPVSYLPVSNVPPPNYCAATEVAEEDTTSFPVCPNVIAFADKNPPNREVQGFDGFVYAISVLCLLFILYESVRSIEIPKSDGRAVSPLELATLLHHNSKTETRADIIERYASVPADDGAGSVEMGQRSKPAPKTASSYSIQEFYPATVDGEIAGQFSENGVVGEDAVRDFADPEAGAARDGAGNLSSHTDQPPVSVAPASLLSLSVTAPTAVKTSTNPPAGASETSEFFVVLAQQLDLFFTLPQVAQTDRYDAIGFARYLASIHIVLGHMYQASHLGTFHNFNKFGYTWVPWFFVLSGYILTHTEKRRRDKLVKQAASTETAAAAAAAAAAATAATQPTAPSGDATATDADGAPTVKSAEKRAASPSPPTVKPMSLVDYVKHRMQTLYPLYLVGICASIITVWAVQGAYSLPLPSDVLIYFLLLQGWVPSILEKGLVYLVQCWFLSCLMFYWCIFYRIYDALEKLSDGALLWVAFIASVLLPLVYQMATFTLAGWSDSHQYLSIHSGVDIAVVVLKFAPVSYIHIFVLGCCLPRVRSVILQIPNVEYALPWFCTVSYTILAAVYCTKGDDVPGFALSFRLGLVSIVQCTLLIGLCNAQDLLGRVFCHPLLKQFGQYGFAQYIFQFIVYAWYNFATQKNEVDIRYFLLLFSTSVIVWTAVVPFNGKRMTKFVMALLPVLVIYLMLQPLFSTYHKANGSNSAHTVKSSDWWVDKPLAIAVSNNLYSQGYATDRPIFNPSLNLQGTRSLFTARRDYVTSQGASWFETDMLVNRWDTQILLGTYDVSTSTQSAVLLKNEGFTPCVPPVTCNGNGTLALKVSTGPEDPRLFMYQGSYYVSVFSYDNILTNGTSPVLDGYGDYGTGSMLCVPSDDGLIGRMYMAKVGTVQSNPCILADFLSVMPTGLNFTDYSIVKNWLAFTGYDDTSSEEQLFFIHQISPQFIVMRTDNVTEDAVHTSVAYNTSSPLEILRMDKRARAARNLEAELTLVEQDSAVVYLSPEQLAYQTGPDFTAEITVIDDPSSDGATAVHGSVNPVYIDGSYSIFGHGYYLSMYHLVSDDVATNYAHYAFGFCESAPFSVTMLSPRVDLTTALVSHASTVCGDAPFAFVTGMALKTCSAAVSADQTGSNMCLLLTYGVCDAESRVSEINLHRFESTLSLVGSCLM